MVIRQRQSSLVSVDVLPSIKVPCHITEKIEENLFRLVTALNCCFAMGIRNKWKLCLKTHSCSSFAIFLHLLLCQDSELLGQLGGIPHLNKQHNHRCRVC